MDGPLVLTIVIGLLSFATDMEFLSKEMRCLYVILNMVRFFILIFRKRLLNLRSYSVLKIMFRIHCNIKGKFVYCDFAYTFLVWEQVKICSDNKPSLSAYQVQVGCGMWNEFTKKKYIFWYLKNGIGSIHILRKHILRIFEPSYVGMFLVYTKKDKKCLPLYKCLRNI